MVIPHTCTHTQTHTQWVTRVCGQVEHKPSEEGEQHAGDDDVYDEVEWEAEQEEVISDVEVGRIWTASVIHPVFPVPVILHHPLPALHEITEVWSVVVLHLHKKMD